MIHVPSDQRSLVSFANDLIEQCRVSVGPRLNYYRLMNIIAETGRFDGNKSLLNLLYRHLDRTASHLFSPVELKFSLDFDNAYPQKILDQGSTMAKHISRQWEKSNTDILFGRGTFECLKYGACLLKQWPQVEGADEKPNYYAKLVLPWQFGVYNESENMLERQHALCETANVTLPEIWRRISHLPNAKKLFDRIKENARTGGTDAQPQSFFHQVLSTSQLDTGVNGSTRTLPGGIVNLGNDPNYALMGPQVSAPVVNVHELWVQDAEMGDYTTIIMIEPDIIVAPFGRKMNLLGVKGAQPYTMIQANEVTNWLWGRSELVDLAEPQALLAQWCDDAKRLTGLQIDKLIGFTGNTGMDDEKYGQFRMNGYIALEQGSDIKDITPKMPAELLPMIKFLIENINTLSGFPNIMQGQGEPGVRAGAHASTLLKTASPTLRDRALLIERNCATAADLTLQIREAKDPSNYWVKAGTAQEMSDTEFQINQLPEDWRVTVDSHSSSPIFSDENAQLLFALRRQGDIDGEFLLDNMPVPNKEQAKAGLALREKAKAAQMQQMLQQYPEVGEKIALKTLTGGRR